MDDLKEFLEGIKNIFEKPVTEEFPKKEFETKEKSRGLLSLDLPGCIGCELCYKICPADAIAMTKLNYKFNRNARNEAPSIDFNKCISCGLCSQICPAEVLHHTKEFTVFVRKEDAFEDPFKLYERFKKEFKS
ncbi:MAG: 4Fe-4S binding protein [Candidatus Rehaiarchaeum fermentans]|nr:4Fe-4S binding protein [Candidatus Rehaiarchaeum fermentans]MCW1292402.1 4Fe-4S binding protein [Candidatus Rehaiarchaeum fermentans]MCW1292952.1 4Fe-4S binding protein [Candidatus Rehaiarchaeum fermentans]MCW1297058.1 4Fe-4S binding protein [Candidatus Rehaiarchaeum fermentans]MCW1302428.1 4Fe-4S binding protein [Candidatus Rehaiarchaeum fermentans]